MLKLGLEQLVEPEVVERADARFAYNDDFDFSVFGEKFDFVVARSIWTHASKAQISAMLASFAATSSGDSVFLTSYHPAGAWFRLARRWAGLERQVTRLPLEEISPVLARLPSLGGSREYRGGGWVGRSHTSDQPGVVEHGLGWISVEAERHGLRVALTSHPVLNHQYWLRITRG